MPDVRGCHLPDELLYDVENHIWWDERCRPGNRVRPWNPASG